MAGGNQTTWRTATSNAVRRGREVSKISTPPVLHLGIEGGATRTVALLADDRGRILRRLEAGSLNLKLAGDREIITILRALRSSLVPQPASLALSLCVAGCRTAADRGRLRRLAARAFGDVSCYVGNDLDSGLAAAFGLHGSGILVISGTGSCVIGRQRGQIARVGGWGHLLGDHGSGYWLASTGLRAAIREYDRTGRTGPVLQAVLHRLCLNDPDQLLDWIQQASKGDLAALAPAVSKRSPALLAGAADLLAADCAVVARRLHLRAPDVVLSGGVFAHQPRFARLTARGICQRLPQANVRLATREPAYGTLILASSNPHLPNRQPFDSAQGRPPTANREPVPLPLTEQRNPRTLDLHRQSIAKLIDTMLAEEAQVVPAVRQAKAAVSRAITTIVAAFRHGGRLFYVGAGTSGRLGVLDASECPPTFSTDPELVQGIIAGGLPALHSSIEGAEDDAAGGAAAIRNRGIRKADVVLGIAASGRTPFVHGALAEAQRRGAKTFLLSCCPTGSPHSAITVLTGPEALTGSTRLKAGTATKIVLNLLTTITMIGCGKVISNLMVDVNPSNLKLRARAIRIVATLRHCDESEARQRLIKARWQIRRAITAAD